MTRDTNQQMIDVANAILRHHDLEATSCNTLQSLWAGYGHICEVRAVSTRASDVEESRSFILKHVTPPLSLSDTQDEGHLRKVISYQVEQYFYRTLAPLVPSTAAMATHLEKPPRKSSNPSYDSSIAMIITDLRPHYPLAGEKRGMLSSDQVSAALDWLAVFHGFWWKRSEHLREYGTRLPPLEEAKIMTSPGGPCSGIWLNGGYTSISGTSGHPFGGDPSGLTANRYLATRLKEYENLKLDIDSEWSKALCEPVPGSDKSAAELAAAVLAPPRFTDSSHPLSAYETLIHGDVKSENFFSSMNGKAVAFYDFQYVGLGLGVCDLAKLFTVSVPLKLLMTPDSTVSEHLTMGEGEKALLVRYQSTLHQQAGKLYPMDALEMHWNTALLDWLRFQASWGFWGNTAWLQARVRHILNDKKYMAWLVEAAGSATREAGSAM